MKRYKLIFSKDFRKIFKKLDSSVQKLVASYIKHNLENTYDPRIHGKALIGDKKGLWRYRISNYRLIVILNLHISIFRRISLLGNTNTKQKKRLR